MQPSLLDLAQVKLAAGAAGVRWSVMPMWSLNSQHYPRNRCKSAPQAALVRFLGIYVRGYASARWWTPAKKSRGLRKFCAFHTCVRTPEQSSSPAMSSQSGGPSSRTLQYRSVDHRQTGWSVTIAADRSVVGGKRHDHNGTRTCFYDSKNDTNYSQHWLHLPFTSLCSMFLSFHAILEIVPSVVIIREILFILEG